MALQEDDSEGEFSFVEHENTDQSDHGVGTSAFREKYGSVQSQLQQLSITSRRMPGPFPVPPASRLPKPSNRPLPATNNNHDNPPIGSPPKSDTTASPEQSPRVTPIIEEERRKIKHFSAQLQSAWKKHPNPVLVFVTKWEIIPEEKKPFAVYHLTLQLGTSTWQVAHRYSSFRALHEQLRKKYAHLANQLPAFPAKRIIGNLNPAFLESRKAELQDYLQKLLNIPELQFCEEVSAKLLMKTRQQVPTMLVGRHDSFLGPAFAGTRDNRSSTLFGATLEEVLAREGTLGAVPTLVEKAIDYLDEHGLDTEGLFRIPPLATDIEALKQRFDSGQPIDLDSLGVDPHVVGGLLKLYLRELPEPVLTFRLYSSFMTAITLPSTQETLQMMRSLVGRLPPANWNLLHQLVHFLARVIEHADANKMTINNIVTIFGPAIMRPPDDDIGAMIRDATSVYKVVRLLIEQREVMFM